MRGLSGTRWGLWLSLLGTLVLTSCVEASDTIRPSVPTGLTAAAASCSQINLRWNAATDTGGSGLMGYNVYTWRNSKWTFLKQVQGGGGCDGTPPTSTSNTGLTVSTTYYYSVAAVDHAGNTSAFSLQGSAVLPTCTTVTTTTSTTTTLVSGDKTAPAVPTGVTAGAATCSQINLTWLASTDTGGSGLRGYNVYRNGVYLKQVLAPATSSSDVALAASAVYSYALKAVDNAGNVSGMSTWVSANTPTCPVVGTGQLRWAKRWGGTGADSGGAITTDGSGNVLVGGSFSNTVDFGSGALSSAGMEDAFLAKYSPDGTPVWSRRLGGTGSERVQGIAVDRSGNVFATGYFQNAVDFGDGSRNSAGAMDIFVAKYSATNGFVWAKTFGTAGNDFGYGVAVDGNGDALVTGTVAGSTNFGGGTVTSISGGPDAFIVKLSGATGAHIWSKMLNSYSNSGGYGVAVDGVGNALVTGGYYGSVIFGGTTYPNAGFGTDVFLAKYAAANGAELWIRHFGGPDFDNGRAIAADLRCVGGSNIGGACTSDGQCPSSSCGSVVITGEFLEPPTESIDFGAGPWSSINTDVFVAKYAVADGAYIWAKHPTAPGGGYENALAVAVDSAGNVAVTGNFSNTIDFGSGALTTAGNADIFVAKLAAANGNQLWAKRYGGSGYETGNAVAVDNSRNVLTTGYFWNSVDFGGGPLPSAGGPDIFVVDLTP